MNEMPVHYALLRDQRHWDPVILTSLQLQTDGSLMLARVPAPVDGQPISIASPYAVEPSGMFLDHNNDLYLSDTANNRVIRIDGACATRAVLPYCPESGAPSVQFQAPRGLIVSSGALYVADSGHASIQVFHLPNLELRAVWQGAFKEPACLASDGRGRIYVLDRGPRPVQRFSALGIPDDAYNAVMDQQLHGLSPTFFAISKDREGADILYVSDDQSQKVLRFDEAGSALSTLPNGASTSPARPAALLVHGDTLYVADGGSGSLWVFDLDAGSYLGTAFSFLGPVTAMALDHTGKQLYIKSGADETTYQLQRDGACVPSGTLTTNGPLDAGDACEWERAHVTADILAGTSLIFQTFVGRDATDQPGPSDWKTAPALDILVPPRDDNGATIPTQYLWLQVQLQSLNQQTSPTLPQVQAATIAPSYLDHLPAVYCREDLPNRFLERWLAFFRSKLSDVETLLDQMPRIFNPATAPVEYLPWIASWLAFEPPQGKPAHEVRRLLALVMDLYRHRGTLSGLREFLELYAGVRPHILEAFRERHVWQLGATSALGFDTALPSADAAGIIIPGVTPVDPRYLGLSGEYYVGINFDEPGLTRVDAVIDFDWGNAMPDPSMTPSGNYPGFSVRWTGQIMPRYSETYTFHVTANDAASLWIDYEEIINNWAKPQPTEQTATISLTAGRWYAITLEYYKKGVIGKSGDASIEFLWSSRSQAKEVVPQSRLYAVLDENANLDVPPQSPGCGTLLVGESVVGQMQPLSPDQFGNPLFSETAHLFTVLVPAARFPKLAERENLKRLIESEKPAHSDFHLCFVEPRMRIGLQSKIGIDSIIARTPMPKSIDVAHLGSDLVLTASAGNGKGGRIGTRGHLGRQTILA